MDWSDPGSNLGASIRLYPIGLVMCLILRKPTPKGHRILQDSAHYKANWVQSDAGLQFWRFQWCSVSIQWCSVSIQWCSVRFQWGFIDVSVGVQWGPVRFQWELSEVSVGVQWGPVRFQWKLSEVSVRFQWESSGVPVGAQ